MNFEVNFLRLENAALRKEYAVLLSPLASDRQYPARYLIEY